MDSAIARYSEPCICCLSRDITCIAVIRAKHLLRCRDCGVYFFAERPTAEELKAYYQSSYSEAHRQQLCNLLRSNYEAGLYEGQVQHLLSFLSDPSTQNQSSVLGRRKRILDFGCGPAYFLKACVDYDRGIEAYGMELDEEIVRLNETMGVRMITNEELVRLPDSFFDGIRSNHILEHLADPYEILALFFQKLKPGGIVIISSPCFSPNIVRSNAMRLYDVVYPEHLSFFTTKSIQKLLERVGFAVELNISQFALTSQALRILGVHERDQLNAPELFHEPEPETLKNYRQVLEADPFNAGSNLFIAGRKTKGGPKPVPFPSASPVEGQDSTSDLFIHHLPTCLCFEEKSSLSPWGEQSKPTNRRGMYFQIDKSGEWNLIWPFQVQHNGPCKITVSGVLTVLDARNHVRAQVLDAQRSPIEGADTVMFDNDVGDFELRLVLNAGAEKDFSVCLSGSGTAEFLVQDLFVSESGKAVG